MEKKPKKKKQELVKVEAQPSPMTLIAQAIKSKVPVESMEKLMDLQDRWDKKIAKIAFDEAMAEFQGVCPIIKKSSDGGTTDRGIVAYKYAGLDAIVSQTRGLIQEYGFSYMIKTETKGDTVKSTCIIKHKLGHSESSDMEVPLGAQTKIMNRSQVVAAAMTFSKRYAFCNAFGIMTGDDDTDGKIDTKPQPQQPKARPIVNENIEQAQFREKPIASSSAELVEVLIKKVDETKDASQLIKLSEWVKTSKNSKKMKDKIQAYINVKVDKIDNETV